MSENVQVNVVDENTLEVTKTVQTSKVYSKDELQARYVELNNQIASLTQELNSVQSLLGAFNE